MFVDALAKLWSGSVTWQTESWTNVSSEGAL